MILFYYGGKEKTTNKMQMQFSIFATGMIYTQTKLTFTLDTLKRQKSISNTIVIPQLHS